MEPKASIGRIVEYMRHGSPDGTHLPEPSPAIITKVANEETQSCHMTVFNPTGLYFQEVPFSKEPKPGHWSWPAFMRK